MLRIAAHLCLALGAMALLSACSDSNPAPREPKLVKTVTVTRGAVEKVTTLTGAVQAQDETNLSFRVSGQITAMHVDVGQSVARGEMLAELDDQQQRADLAIAQASLRASEAQLIQARSNWERQESLFERGIVARSTLDQAQEAHKTAENTHIAAQSELASAQEALSFTRLVAPADGVILSRDGETGQIAQEAQPVLAMAQGDGREALFAVPESVLLAGRPSSVSVALIGSSLAPVEAKVREISPSVDLETGTVAVTVALPAGAQTRFPLGAPVTGGIRVRQGDLVVLPWSAITAFESAPAVWVVDPQTASANLRKVEIGSHQTGSFQVVGGLDVGERVVVEGGKLLRPGETVTLPQEAGS